MDIQDLVQTSFSHEENTDIAGVPLFGAFWGVPVNYGPLMYCKCPDRIEFYF